MKKITLLLSILASAFALSACCTVSDNSPSKQSSACAIEYAQPKLTKDMFYKNGKFDEAMAKQAYFDMMTRLGYPISENMRKNMWATDFGLGDFPAVGMGGIFWAMEDKNGVFGHEILLLPNQMLVEHYHVPAGKSPAKHECWQARAGESYCFGEVGEVASKFPSVKVPESQKKFVTVDKVGLTNAKEGNVLWLNRLEARHYQIAGPQGAVVTEYGAFHSGDGVKFTNPNVKF